MTAEILKIKRGMPATLLPGSSSSTAFCRSEAIDSDAARHEALT